MSCRALPFAMSSLLALSAHAGTILESTNKDLSGSGRDSASTIYAENGRMRMENKPGDSFMIFKDDAIYVMQSKNKTYSVMDRASLKKMADQLSPAIKQMQEQMAKMPPEQRAQMERMMGGAMPGMGKESKQEVRKTARTGKFGGHNCSYVEILTDGVMTEEMCVAPAGSIKGGQDLMDASNRIAAMVKDAFTGIEAPWLKQMISQQVESYSKIGGIPLLSRHYSNGKPAAEATVTSIRNQSVAASQFEIPSGYTKTDLTAR